MAKRLLYEDNSHRLLVKIDGKDTSVRNPISFYHLALMEYSPNLALEEIVLFEKMLVFFRANKLRPFEYQQDRLEEELHIKRTKLVNARAKLMKAEILVEVNPGKGKKIRYSLNKDKIIALVSFMYKMPDNEQDKAQTIKELQTFYEYYLSKKYLKEMVDESLPDLAYEGRYQVIGSDKRKYESNNSDNDMDSNSIV